MCGSGTTLVEATLTGRQGWGADIDPLARLIAEARSRPVDPTAIALLADRTERQLADGVVDDGWRPEGIDLSKWFRDDVAVDLARLQVLLRDLAEHDPLRSVAWAVYCSALDYTRAHMFAVAHAAASDVVVQARAELAGLIGDSFNRCL
jgi:hypothetical protein